MGLLYSTRRKQHAEPLLEAPEHQDQDQDQDQEIKHTRIIPLNPKKGYQPPNSNTSNNIQAPK